MILRDRNGLGNNTLFAWKDCDKFYVMKRSTTFRGAALSKVFRSAVVDDASQSYDQIPRGVGDEHFLYAPLVSCDEIHKVKRQIDTRVCPLILPQKFSATPNC